MNGDDSQTLRDVKHLTGVLLDHADVLPDDLAVMLGDFMLEISNPSRRWNGIGDPVQDEEVARRIGQWVTDGEWHDGQRLDSPDNWHYRMWSPDKVRRALQLLTARGEIVVKDGGYYMRSHSENS